MSGPLGRVLLVATIIAVLIACGTFIQANETCSFPWQECYGEQP